MKYILSILILCFWNCTTKESIPTGTEILEKSIKVHDPKHKWNTSNFVIRVQEPRIGNPVRYSIIKMNNKDKSFELKRNRDEFISTHIVTNDTAKTFLNGKIETDTTLIKKYRLEPRRNKRYQRFYHVLLGLPMSLPTEISEINSVTTTFFNKEDCYKISVTLNEPLFSKHWNIFFSKENDRILGVEMIFPENPNKGERLVFEEKCIIDEMMLPRIRHWKELDDTYSGSDILLEIIEK